MKPYQHHDEYHDIGKAEPHPRRATQDSPRKLLGHFASTDEYSYAKKGYKSALLTAIRRVPRAVTVKRQSRGPAAQKKAHRL